MALVLMVSCASSLLKPSVKDTERGKAMGIEMTLTELETAHKVYKLRCGSCHYLYRPYQFTKERWMEVMPDMKHEAKLTDDQYRILVNYLLVMRDSHSLQ